MQLILILAGAIGLIVGSLAAAALLCWFLWYSFRLVMHPEWAISVVLILLVLAAAGELPRSQFLGMTLTFAVVAAVPLWFAGRAWRRQRRQAMDGWRKPSAKLRRSPPIPPPEAGFPRRPYPAITGCIGEDRIPTRGEVHLVASRLWREGFAQRFGSRTAPASFATRRALLRAATVALSGRHADRRAVRGAAAS